MRDLVVRIRRRLPGGLSEPGPDPFETLALQSRLTRLAAEINTLDGEPGRSFAGNHHTRAAQLAYQQTLDEACHLIGAPVEGTGPTHRLMAEARLIHAGWKW